MADQPTNSGIVTDSAGERHIPESTRADGSVRKAIKIRPGYRPPEDVQVYKNRTAETFRNRYKGGVLGAEAAPTDGDQTPSSSSAAAAAASTAAALKNAKRREARKKAKAESNGKKDDDEKWMAAAATLATEPPARFFENRNMPEDTAAAAAAADQDPEVERKKKARNLTKKLKQARELKSKKDDGQSLLPEQFAKVIKINELVRELAALGFDAEGEPAEEGKDEAKAPAEAPA